MQNQNGSMVDDAGDWEGGVGDSRRGCVRSFLQGLGCGMMGSRQPGTNFKLTPTRQNFKLI